MLLLILVCAAACSPTNNNASTTPNLTPVPIEPTTLPTDETGLPIVAKVNDTGITLADYELTVHRYQSQPYADPDNLPKIVLQTMIQQVLIDQAAAKNKVIITDAQVDKEIQSLISTSGGTDGWNKWLHDNGFTEAELRRNMHETLLTSQMRDRVVGDLSAKVPQVHARHILVSTEDQANQLLVRLRNGEDFGALAKQYSLDKSSSINGGDLGWFVQEELVEPELAQVAFQLKVGQIAGPIKTSVGYDILQTLETDNRVIDPDKRAQIAQVRFENWLKALAASAKIETYL
jgi:parvulin-like peptidyl-prolyl isomerase